MTLSGETCQMGRITSVCDTTVAAAVHPCDDVKSDDVTAVRTSVSAADLHLFYLVDCNEWSSVPVFLLHISNRPWVSSLMS